MAELILLDGNQELTRIRLSDEEISINEENDAIQRCAALGQYKLPLVIP